MPGVYLLKDEKGRVLYVGKANNLKVRVSSYFTTSKGNLLPKTSSLVSKVSRLDYVVTESEIDALLLEANYIRKFQPDFNATGKGGSSFPFIEITNRERVPTITIRRRQINSRATYFGPYPTGTALSSMLTYLRRIFPYVSQKHPGGKACLRFHLGLCPCPNVFSSGRRSDDYRKTVRRIIQFLSGKRKAARNDLVTEMTAAAKRQDFETAADLKRKIARLDWLVSPRTVAWEYEINPNLVADRRREEVACLERVLDLSPIRKIECVDVANISGKSASGSLVVCVDGFFEKSLYRRFRISTPAAPDDYGMISEVVSRRLAAKDALPDLLVVDGGKGHLATVWKLVKSVNKHPMVVALAKRRETLYTTDGKELNLRPDSPALQLLQRLRDEAHRFGRKYHFWLRRQSMIT